MKFGFTQFSQELVFFVAVVVVGMHQKEANHLTKIADRSQ